MKIELVFWEWKGQSSGPVLGGERIALETGGFRAGSVYEGTINLTAEQLADIRDSVTMGFRPIFQIKLSEEVKK